MHCPNGIKYRPCSDYLQPKVKKLEEISITIDKITTGLQSPIKSKQVLFLKLKLAFKYKLTLNYNRGLKYFDLEYLKGDEEEKDLGKFLELTQALLMNLALSNFKLGEYREALNSVEKVLENQSKHIKALYIKGKILLQLGDTKEAINSLNQSLQLDPNNAVSKFN